MTVNRHGKQMLGGKTHRSHVSGRRASRFAAKIKDNLDFQARRLEAELKPKAKP